jgi:hypothetical protein
MLHQTAPGAVSRKRGNQLPNVFLRRCVKLLWLLGAALTPQPARTKPEASQY